MDPASKGVDGVDPEANVVNGTHAKAEAKAKAVAKAAAKAAVEGVDEIDSESAAVEGIESDGEAAEGLLCPIALLLVYVVAVIVLQLSAGCIPWCNVGGGLASILRSARDFPL